MRRLFVASALIVASLLAAPAARADKVAVLPFTSPKAVPKPELEEVRAWTRKAVIARQGTLPNDQEMISAERAVKDGTPDMSAEYRAAGVASGSHWTVTARVERIDVQPAKRSDGKEEEGYTTYRVELEACQVESGRVESLAREIDPDEGEAQIGEMLALLLRPDGIANADIPWATGEPRKRKAKPEPPLPPPPPKPPPPPPPPPEPVVKHGYAEGRPFALGASIGATDAPSRPDQARGPSFALPIGAAFAYAIAELPGVELRGVFTSHVVGPKAIEISAGGRYAIPLLPQHRFFVGPELLLGTHVAIGADRTARFLTHGAAFAALGIGERVQLEIAGDLSAALGGTGTLILGGGTARALFRF